MRRRHLPESPKSSVDIDLSDCRNRKGEHLVLSDKAIHEDQKVRVIILGTDTDIRYLSKSHVWYADGTFSIAPCIFISCPCTGTVNNPCVLPLDEEKFSYI